MNSDQPQDGQGHWCHVCKNNWTTKQIVCEKKWSVIIKNPCKQVVWADQKTMIATLSTYLHTFALFDPIFNFHHGLNRGKSKVFLFQSENMLAFRLMIHFKQGSALSTKAFLGFNMIWAQWEGRAGLKRAQPFNFHWFQSGPAALFCRRISALLRILHPPTVQTSSCHATIPKTLSPLF